MTSILFAGTSIHTPIPPQTPLGVWVGKIKYMEVDLSIAVIAKLAMNHNNNIRAPTRKARTPSTNASTLVRPSWRRDSLAVILNGVLAPARKMGRGAHGGGQSQL